MHSPLQEGRGDHTIAHLQEGAGDSVGAGVQPHCRAAVRRGYAVAAGRTCLVARLLPAEGGDRDCPRAAPAAERGRGRCRRAGPRCVAAAALEGGGCTPHPTFAKEGWGGITTHPTSKKEGVHIHTLSRRDGFHTSPHLQKGRGIPARHALVVDRRQLLQVLLLPLRSPMPSGWWGVPNAHHPHAGECEPTLTLTHSLTPTRRSGRRGVRPAVSSRPCPYREHGSPDRRTRSGSRTVRPPPCTHTHG